MKQTNKLVGGGLTVVVVIAFVNIVDMTSTAVDVVAFSLSFIGRPIIILFLVLNE